MDRFGILALAWVLIGYFNIFDLGIGRALTQIIAEGSGITNTSELSAYIKTGLVLTVALGFAAALVLGLVSPFLVQSVLRVPPMLRQESSIAFVLLALTLPVVISSAALKGVLEARQRFGLVNAVRIPVGVLQYLGPLLVAPFSQSLVAIVAVLAVLRLVAWATYFLMCLSTVPSLRLGLVFERTSARKLLRLGSWMTVSNIVSPLMTFSDRFMVGALASIGAVAYYATPNEIITRVMLIPVALTSVLFPAFATGYGRYPEHTRQVFDRAVKYVFLALLPIVVIAISFAKPALRAWLGPQFAESSAVVLQVLAIGVLFNGTAQVPFALIQAVGRPDLTAKLHIIEAPIYFVLAILMIRAYGINGAALAWSLRVGADALLLFLLVRRFVFGSAARGWPRGPVSLAVAILGLSFAVASSHINASAGVGLAAALYAVLVLRLLSVDERNAALRLLGGHLPITG